MTARTDAEWVITQLLKALPDAVRTSPYYRDRVENGWEQSSYHHVDRWEISLAGKSPVRVEARRAEVVGSFLTGRREYHIDDEPVSGMPLKSLYRKFVTRLLEKYTTDVVNGADVVRAQKRAFFTERAALLPPHWTIDNPYQNDHYWRTTGRAISLQTAVTSAEADRTTFNNVSNKQMCDGTLLKDVLELMQAFGDPTPEEQVLIDYAHELGII